MSDAFPSAADVRATAAVAVIAGGGVVLELTAGDRVATIVRANVSVVAGCDFAWHATAAGAGVAAGADAAVIAGRYVVLVGTTA